MSRHPSDMGVTLPDGTYVCDGCNVLGVHEHRCHGSDGAWRGAPPCGCKQCADDEAAYLAWRASEEAGTR